MMKRHLAAMMLILLCLLGIRPAAADIILEPVSTFEIALGIDGNYHEFRQDKTEDSSNFSVYVECSCGNPENHVTVNSWIVQDESCPYDITLESKDWSYTILILSSSQLYQNML